jgi:hypothetical protein
MCIGQQAQTPDFMSFVCGIKLMSEYQQAHQPDFMSFACAVSSMHEAAL